MVDAVQDDREFLVWRERSAAVDDHTRLFFDSLRNVLSLGWEIHRKFPYLEIVIDCQSWCRSDDRD